MELGVKAAIIPTAPLNVQTLRDVNDVVISWQTPSANSVVDFGD